MKIQKKSLWFIEAPDELSCTDMNAFKGGGVVRPGCTQCPYPAHCNVNSTPTETIETH